jgi:hypothetical protein
MKGLIIGNGEVGKSLYSIFKRYYETEIIDKDCTPSTEEPEILHICFPYSEEFEDEVKKYQARFQPNYTVIHSTVPIGTSRRLKALHSPIRGLHPNLEGGILTFDKFIGGEDSSAIADYFRRAGIKIHIYEKQETTELLKLLDTEYYRVCIEFCHKARDLCKKFELSFSEVYTLPNITYNEGYKKLDYDCYIRPVLQPIEGVIKGHCVMPNKILLEKSLCE